jgi:tetratricopeptide (TPR) repeat protein
MTSLSFKNGDSSLGIQAGLPTKEEKEVVHSGVDESPVVAVNEIDTAIPQEQGDWFSTVHKALDEGRMKDAEKAFNEYFIGEKNKEDAKKNKALYLYYKYIQGKDDSALDDLIELVSSIQEEDIKSDVAEWLSLCYRDSLQHSKEIALWEKEVKEYQSPVNKTKAVVNLAYALERDEQMAEARELLVKHLKSTEEEKLRSTIFAALAKVENSLGNKRLGVFCKDKSIEFDPNNRDKIFNSAHAASNEGQDGLAISNYLRLIKLDHNYTSALNNLGVVV